MEDNLDNNLIKTLLFAKNVLSHLPHPCNTTKSNVIIAKGNSISSNHYITENDAETILNYIDNNYSGPSVSMFNAETLIPTKTGHLPLAQELSQHPKQTAVLQHLQNDLMI